MAKKPKLPFGADDLPENLDEKKKFYKMLLTPMPFDEKLDELGDLSNEELAELLEQFKADQDYEICHAIKAVLEGRK